MSGEWAKACDKWSGEYRIDRDWELRSANFIVDALVFIDIYDTQPVRSVEVAGLQLRAWRKSLGEHSDTTGRRQDRPEDIPQEQLLWTALACVAYAATVSNLELKARYLRHAEANLRTWWKREED